MLQLQPDKSAEPLILPDKNSEIVREADTVVDLDQPLQIPEKAITVMRVRTGHFTINVSINTLRPADRLVVTFQGARGGGKETTNSRRPMFGRRNFDALYECPILAISDPQTELDWDSHLPRVGMYLGTFENDLVPEINALVDKFCVELKIPLGRVVMYGSSSGGTSAILIGSRRKHPTNILTVVPFLRPDKYREEVVAITARAAGGTLDDWNRGMIAQPWRYNPVVALRDAITAGFDIRCVVAQNARDKVTINRHYPGLWRRFDIDPEGGVSPDGRVMAVMFDSPEAGHGHEPDDYARPLVKMAYEFFDKPIAEEGKEKKSKLRERADTRAAIKEQLGKDAKSELRRSAKADKGVKVEKTGKTGKIDKTGGPNAKPDKGFKAAKAAKLAIADKQGRPAKADKQGRPAKADKLVKAQKADKLVKASKADKLAKGVKPAKGPAGKPAKPVRANKQPSNAAQANPIFDTDSDASSGEHVPASA